jgi:outer membrane lipoprotein carrier protein
MRKLTVFLGLFWYALFSLNAVSAQSESAVQRYFKNLQSLRADFVQTVSNEKSRLVQSSSGEMWMQKPGRFRWDYREPYKQLIVADGERLWLYDSDLQQVTVKRMDKALSATPLALLSGAAPIEETFTVSAATTQGGLQWYELYPKDAQAEFKVLRVAFAGDALNTIELEDVFNQRTRLAFGRLERNVKIDPALLRFAPPPGVDVVGDVP